MTIVLALLGSSCSTGSAPEVPVNRADGAEEATRVHLSSLSDSCILTREWIGIWPTQSEGLWLACGGESILIVHPRNLYRRVNVETKEQALEFATLLTDYDSAQSSSMLFSAFYYHEPNWRYLSELAEAGVAQADELMKAYLEPEVRVHVRKESHDVSDEGKREFHIYRLLVNQLDGHVYKVAETVDENGWYSILEQSLVFHSYYELDVGY